MSRQTDTKITALYERLSRDDDQIGDSNSIVNQKRMLEDYASQHGFDNCVHFTDDGWSGGNFNRPAWKQLVAEVEAGRVATVIAKDMSRIGRTYLQTGWYTEVFFRENGVRFIAVANGVDSSDQNTEEFAPFLNIMSEWYLRDCSRKLVDVYLRFIGNFDVPQPPEPELTPEELAEQERIREKREKSRLRHLRYRQRKRQEKLEAQQKALAEMNGESETT